MRRIRITACAVLAHFTAVTGPAVATGAGAPDNPSNEVRGGVPSSDQNQLAAGIQDAIYRNRQQLLEFITDRKTRSAVCTPAPNDSYDLFQESVQEKLDVLWDLDIYAAKYGLSEKQHFDVRTCAAQMEKYLGNFHLWKKLVRN